MGENYSFGDVLFASMEAKRFTTPDRFPKNIRINHNPNISNFRKLDDNRMVLGYQYNISFEAVGYIRMEGEILVRGPADTMDAAWNKEKKLPPEFMEKLLGHLLTQAGFEAMKLAQKLKMPFPFPLNVPKISLQKKEEKKKGAKRAYHPEVA